MAFSRDLNKKDPIIQGEDREAGTSFYQGREMQPVFKQRDASQKEVRRKKGMRLEKLQRRDHLGPPFFFF